MWVSPREFSFPRARVGQGQRRQRGFTLLELLVVIAIIVVLVGTVSLSMGVGEHKVLKEEARRLAALMELAAQESILQSSELAFELNQQGYAFYRLEDQQWQVMEDDELLHPRDFPEQMQVELSIEGESVSVGEAQQDDQPPRVYILSSGEITPFEMSLRLQEGGQDYKIRGNLAGKLELIEPQS